MQQNVMTRPQFDKYINLVHSFSIQRWFNKPKKLTPYNIARFGYSCTASNQLICIECGVAKQYSVEDENNMYSRNKQTDLIQIKTDKIDAFLTLLRNAHSTECSYKKSIFQFKINKSFLYQEADNFYHENMQSFQIVSNDEILLPDIDLSFATNIPIKVLQRCILQSNDLQFNVASTLSIFGWKYIPKSSTDNRLEGQQQCDILCCQFCGRKVRIQRFSQHLGLAQPFFMDTNEQILGNERIKTPASKNKFNVITQHLYFCKWARPIDKAEKMSSNLKQMAKVQGWNICLNLLYEKIKQEQGKSNIFDAKQEIGKMQQDIQNRKQQIIKLQEQCLKQYENIKDLGKDLHLEQTNIYVGNQDLKLIMRERRQKLEDMFQELKKQFSQPKSKKIKSN